MHAFLYTVSISLSNGIINAIFIGTAKGQIYLAPFSFSLSFCFSFQSFLLLLVVWDSSNYTQGIYIRAIHK